MKKRKPVLLNGEALMADGKPLEFDAVNQEELDGKIDAPQTAAVGEVLTVEEVGEDGKPKKWKTQTVAAGQKQADWNQNDETAADHVKNRPFYVADEAPLGEVVFTARSVNAITHTVNAMSIKVLTAIFSNTDIHVPRPQIRLFLCGKFYAANVYFDRGNFSFTSDEISGHVNYNTGSEWYLEVQDNSVSFTVGESYSVAFFDINNKGYVKIPLGYFPDSIFTQESAPVRYGDGNLSTIQGSNTTASANNSHAEGMNTTASGIESHAEGINTTASGDESHAEGSGTKASGNFSHVEGFGTIASGDTQHVQGSYNLSDTTSAHIVGNGTYKQRSNAYTLDWKGNAWFSGNVYVGSTSGTNKDKGSKKLVDTSELSELLGMVQNYAIPNPATAQVGQIVKVKAVDADGKVIETETIPHPVLYVTISKTGNTNTSDKTFAEIKSAYDSGCSVFAVVDSFVLPLLGILDNMACFCATTPDRELHRVSVLITEFGVSLAYGSFVEGNQGVENAGKILGIGNDGNVVPEDKPVQALAGAAAPTTTTAGVVGQEYYVIVNNAVTEMYVCTSALSGSYTWDKVEFGGAGMDITGAKVGQIAKITAVDSAGKPTAWEPVDMPAVPNDYELVFQETVAEDVGAYSRDTDKDGNPFSLTDVMVIIFTKPFAESTNSVGRGLGFLPTSRWGHDTVSCDIGSSISSANTNSVGRYNVVFVKVVNGYQVVTRAYESQNTTNVFGILMRQTKADNEMFRFHTDATKLMQLDTPQGNITCVKIVGYLNPLVSAGTIVALYKKKGT